MKRKSTFKAICGLIGCVLASLVMINEAIADGIDELGPPSIGINPGSYVLVEGTGLVDGQPDDITIEIPAGVSIAQVLLYWSGREGADDTIEVDGTEVTGALIGGSATAANTYRADITSSNWVAAGVNVLPVGGLDFSPENNGAALVVIVDDGSTVDIEILDGSDLAYLPWGAQTKPVDIPVALSSDSQTGTLHLIVTDIEVPRPAALQITMGGVTNLLTDVFLDNEGPDLDVVELEVVVPAGVTNITVQALSINDGPDLEPASLYWHFVSWVIPEPADEGCTYTIGYWKNHPEDWPTDTLSIFSGVEAMDILQTKPTGGNAYIILAHQYIGAELNVVNGASIPADVLMAWLDAQDLLLEYESEGDIDKKTEAEDRAEAIDLAGMLDDYNNGDLGPGHCD
jgi:hypothetical protein